MEGLDGDKPVSYHSVSRFTMGYRRSFRFVDDG